jgi:hypothetical protein
MKAGKPKRGILDEKVLDVDVHGRIASGGLFRRFTSEHQSQAETQVSDFVGFEIEVLTVGIPDRFKCYGAPLSRYYIIEFMQ